MFVDAGFESDGSGTVGTVGDVCALHRVPAKNSRNKKVIDFLISLIFKYYYLKSNGAN
jgi:hypothetical protein